MRSLTLCLALLFTAPFLSLFWLAIGDPSDAAFNGQQLWRCLSYSLAVVLGAGGLAMAIGCYSAWYVSRYEFPFRRIIEWALLLPLAIPPYILAIVFGHQLDVAGPVQAWLRDNYQLSVGEYWFPNIRSPLGAAAVMGFSLYPYVYLLARDAFQKQCQRQFEAAWLSGYNPHQWLWCVAIPAARPALSLGVALVMMETLADFGVVSLFGIPTFTTEIYRVWYGLADLLTAAWLAWFLLALVVVCVALEQYSRRHLPNAERHEAGAHLLRFQVSKPRQIYYLAACSFPVFVGFGIPLLQLLYWSLADLTQWQDRLHWLAAGQGVMVALFAALLAIGFATAFAYLLRTGPPRWQQWLLKLPSLGYAVPGSVIAVAIFIPLLLADKQIANVMQSVTGERPGLWFTGSIAAMVIACTIRFMAVAMANMQAGLSRLPTQIDDASRLLGTSGFRMARLLHLPQLKWTMLAGGFMVFAETLKELPASILLRPYDVSTLSIRTYELALDSRLTQASVPALMMSLIGLGAVLLLILIRRSDRSPEATTYDKEAVQWAN